MPRCQNVVPEISLEYFDLTLQSKWEDWKNRHRVQASKCQGQPATWWQIFKRTEKEICLDGLQLFVFCWNSRTEQMTSFGSHMFCHSITQTHTGFFLLQLASPISQSTFQLRFRPLVSSIKRDLSCQQNSKSSSNHFLRKITLSFSEIRNLSLVIWRFSLNVFEAVGKWNLAVA